MAFSLGSNTIDKVKLGSSPVDAVYKGADLVYSSGFSFTITGGEDLNINTLAIAAGWNESDDLTVTVTGEITGSTPTVVGLDGSTLDSATVLHLIFQNYARGAGGVGGTSNANGANGGNALRLGCNTTIDNSAGHIWAGGGGGAGALSKNVATFNDIGGEAGCQETSINLNGTGGGGGAGNNAGAGGATGALQGSSGTTTAGGAGGTNSTGHGNCPLINTAHYEGGAGGDPGEAGSGPATGSATGGAAGLAIDQNGFTATFTAGNDAARVKGAVT